MSQPSFQFAGSHDTYLDAPYSNGTKVEGYIAGVKFVATWGNQQATTAALQEAGLSHNASGRFFPQDGSRNTRFMISDPAANFTRSNLPSVSSVRFDGTTVLENARNALGIQDLDWNDFASRSMSGIVQVGLVVLLLMYLFRIYRDWLGYGKAPKQTRGTGKTTQSTSGPKTVAPKARASAPPPAQNKSRIGREIDAARARAAKRPIALPVATAVTDAEVRLVHPRHATGNEPTATAVTLARTKPVTQKDAA